MCHVILRQWGGEVRLNTHRLTDREKLLDATETVHSDPRSIRSFSTADSNLELCSFRGDGKSFDVLFELWLSSEITPCELGVVDCTSHTG